MGLGLGLRLGMKLGLGLGLGLGVGCTRVTERSRWSSVTSEMTSTSVAETRGERSSPTCSDMNQVSVWSISTMSSGCAPRI